LPVRIYALAKELDLDSKDLVDLCAKVGIQGKGSALASLTDDEVAKIRSYLKSGGPRAAPPKPPVATSAANRPIRTLTGQPRRRPTAPPEPPRQEPTVAAPPVPPAPHSPAPLAPQPPLAPPQPAASQPAAPPPAPPESPAPPEVKTPAAATIEPARPVPPPQRPDFSAARFGKVKTLPARPQRAEGQREGKKPAKPSKGPVTPIIRAAAIPEVKQPPKPAAPEEPAPQKPEIRLPLDAIRSAKTGTGGASALKERVRQLEERKKKSDAGLLPLEEETPGRGRGRGGAPADLEDGSPISREVRKQKRRKRQPARGDDEAEPVRTSVSRRRGPKRPGVSTAAPRKGNVVVQLPCTVREFSEALGVPASQVLGKLLQLGTLSNINAELDPELAELLAAEFGIEVDFKQPADPEEELAALFEQEDDPEQLQPRPPVVTFLGHVDHGKTSLLDRIIGTRVVAGEAGGITQHIRAYRVEKDGRAIAFVDTPGHEAFTEMRARGANVTDIAVLVVAADDGVMPQTEEAINHARAAGVPIVVALNKIDLPGIDINRIMQQLAASGLLPVEWGGETELVKCSALTGQGVDDLLETLLTIAELHEYKANPNRPAFGTCLEAERHEGRGVVAKVLVQKGTLKVGDIVVCGPAYGRVKAMYDTLKPNVRHEQAGPSTPVNLTGLNEVPGAGDHFYVLDDLSKAREIAEKRLEASRQNDLVRTRPVISLENLRERLEAGHEEARQLNVIIRADVRGSIEAILKEFTKLEHPEVQIKVLQAMVGGITEADVHLADASDAIIIGFNVVPDEGARALAKQKGVQIRRYDVIYRITEDLRDALEGMLKPEKQEMELGVALVQRVFTISRIGSIAGCRVVRGVIRRESDAQTRFRVIRNNTIIGDYPLASLKREKDDVREVREGLECGIRLEGFNDIKEGDVLEAYKVEEVARKL